jgi:glycerol-3-phosphate dehydrogenase (NAD(P)+)
MVLHANHYQVRLWSHDPDYARLLARTRENPKFLPGVALPEGITIGSEARLLALDTEAIFSVIPTQFLRASLKKLRDSLPQEGLFVSCSKGLERGTLELPSRILSELLPRSRVTVLSGPSHAEEVSRGLPTAVVAASAWPEDSKMVQRFLGGPAFRVYSSKDPQGVEVGGAAKNVMAIAAGIADGLGFGDNARAAIITRGLREITRIGTQLGARAETFAGLSGMGDLIATATSSHSRNRTVGFRIGLGESLPEILGSTEKVAEGVETTRSIYEMGERTGVEVPITREVHAVLFEGKPPREAVEALMSRETREELE